MMFFLRRTAGVFIYVVLVASECPGGFVRHQDSCYHFSHDKETWLDALVACRELYSGYLAEITDTLESNFINNEVESRAPLNSSVRYWIGGDDLQIEGEFKWAHSGDVFGFTNWRPGNPDNSALNENCVEILELDGTKGPEKAMWNDMPCNFVTNYICEKDASDVEVVG